MDQVYIKTIYYFLFGKELSEAGQILENSSWTEMEHVAVTTPIQHSSEAHFNYV